MQDYKVLSDQSVEDLESLLIAGQIEDFELMFLFLHEVRELKAQLTTIQNKITTMAATLTLQDVTDAINAAQTDETAEIARFAADLAKAIAAITPLADGSIVLTQDQAAALIGAANGISTAAKAADVAAS